MAGIGGVHETADGRRLELTIPDEAAFEAMRDALGDPVWLVGATWAILTTNDYKRGRFDDALGAWIERQPADQIVVVLAGTGVSVGEAGR